MKTHLIYKYVCKISTTLFVVLTSTFVQAETSLSSVTETGHYTNFLAGLLKRDPELKEFRNKKPCLGVVDTVSPKQGRAIYHHLKNNHPHLLAKNILALDKVGNPLRITLRDGTKANPTYLRYLEIVGDLNNLFGSLDGMTIIEVGGGYGGQAMLIKKLYPSVKYTIIDLPEALAITRRYLDLNGVSDVNLISAHDMLQKEAMPSDLFISNYAYSELYTRHRRNYLQKVIVHAKRGYMRMNQLKDRLKVKRTAHKEYHELADKQQACQELKKANINFSLSTNYYEKMRNVPNYIVTWGHN